MLCLIFTDVTHVTLLRVQESNERNCTETNPQYAPVFTVPNPFIQKEPL